MNDKNIDKLEKKLDDVADLLKILVTQQSEILKNSSQNIPQHLELDTAKKITEELLKTQETQKVDQEPKVETNPTLVSVSKPNSNIEQTINFLSGEKPQETKKESVTFNGKEIKPINVDEFNWNKNTNYSKKDELPSEKLKADDTKSKKHIQKSQEAYNKNKTNLETFIGKNVFVILASLLIFIGVIFFAKVLLPHVPKWLQFALMCLFSAGFTAFGHFLVQKKQNNLTIAVLACGLGTIYITLLTGNLYFKFFNEILLYIALLCWIMVVYFSSRYKSIVFNIIGQAGIIISLLLNIMNSKILSNGRLLLYMLIFTVVAEILYSFLFRKTDKYVNVVGASLSQLILALPIFYNFPTFTKLRISEIFAGERLALAVIWLLFFAYSFISNIFTNRKDQLKFSIVSIINFLVFASVLNSLHYDSFDVVKIIYLVYAIITFISVEINFYSKERKPILNAVSIVSASIILLLYLLTFDKVYISCLILVLPLSYYLYRTNTTLSKKIFFGIIVVATILNYIHANSYGTYFVFRDEIQVHNIIYYISSILLSILCYLIISKAEKQSDNKKLGLYLFTVINIYFVFNSMAVDNITYNNTYGFFKYSTIMNLLALALGTAIQFIFNYVYPIFKKIPQVQKQTNFIIYFIINVVISIIGCLHLSGMSSRTILYLIGSLLLITLFMLNSSVFLIEKNSKASIYVGLKITFLIFFLLRPYNIAPIVSILLFVWAVVCIMIGQKFNQRYLRVYALILSLVSAVKLLLIDISYTSSLSRALSFIICGLLCFLISYLYNKIEKSNKKNEEVIVDENLVEELSLGKDTDISESEIDLEE